MFAKFSCKVTNYLLCKKVIKDDDREIYQYGFEQFFRTLLNVVTMLLLGIGFGEIYQCIILTVSFIALRSYSGGYHANTSLRCYILTVSSISAALSIMKFIAINRFICLGLLVLSSVIILLFSPIGTKNKPLDEIEKIIYRKKTIIVWCIEICVALMFMVFNITQIHISVVLAQILVGFALISGKVQTRNFK